MLPPPLTYRADDPPGRRDRSYPAVKAPHEDSRADASSKKPETLRVMDFFWMCPTYAGPTIKLGRVAERQRWWAAGPEWFHASGPQDRHTSETPVRTARAGAAACGNRSSPQQRPAAILTEACLWQQQTAAATLPPSARHYPASTLRPAQMTAIDLPATSSHRGAQFRALTISVLACECELRQPRESGISIKPGLRTNDRGEGSEPIGAGSR